MINKKILLIISLLILVSLQFTGCALFISGGTSDTIAPATQSVIATIATPVATTVAPTETVADTEPINSSVNIDSYIDNMTLEEKVAQMILVSCHEEVDIEDAVSKGVGGLCLYYLSFDGKTKSEVIDMTSNYQSLADIPLIISTDEEGGTVNRVSLNDDLRAVPFWAPTDLFEYGGWELVKSDTEEKADLLLSLGINVNLAPVCDVPLNEDNYIYDRCFGMDANSTGAYVTVVVSTMKQKGIGSTLKHFPGYGGSVDTHENVAYDNREYSAFENGDFIPFECGIACGADSVLVSHNIVTCMDADMPASLSKPVHDILRYDLGFEGVIMTDDLVMDAITKFTDGENAAVYAVMAGNDMLCCQDYDSAISAIVDAVTDGRISEEQINSSVNRILKWKSDISII